MKNLNETAGILKSLAPKIIHHEETPRSLYEKLDVQSSGVKQGLTEERLRASIGHLRALTSFFRWYPDLYLDSIKDPGENFKFYAYQRLFLRCALRHRYMYATFPRAYSKSFLAIMAEYLKCVFYPNSKLFIVSGGKEQSAKIAQEKIDELWKFFPSLRNEIIEGHGVKNGSIFKQDYIKLVFKNGSYLDIVAARQSSRGGRRTSQKICVYRLDFYLK